MRGLACLVALAAASALAVAGSTRASAPLPEQRAALKAVSKAAAAGHLTPTEAGHDRSEIARAVRLIRGLPASRSHAVATALAQAGALAGRLSAPRAAIVFGQLKANDDYFATHWAPAPKTDVTGDDGVVYRYFSGRCLEFHPLANFGALNAHVAAKDVDATRALADALIARGVHPAGGGIVWEYQFAFGGGKAPWTSGMAQAVAAQAFARAAALVPDAASEYTGVARAAYQAIAPRLLTNVAAGPWIRLYSFDRMPVLNAQLQTVLSLQSYAAATGDTQATALATRMEQSAAATLGRFDTGYWSLYSLAGDASPVDYQQFVASLLTRLGSQDARFANAAVRFKAYLQQPPAFQLANAGLGQIRFWLSKPASVRVSSGAGPSKRLSLGGGWHTVGWPEPKRPGAYGVTVQATGWAGHTASFQALPIVRATSTPRAKGKPKPPARATAAAAPGAAAQPSLLVGAGLDDPSQAALAARAGLHAVRMGLPWIQGSATPDPGALAALAGLPAGTSLVLELIADPLPVDDAGRTALAAYAAAVAQQTPSLRDLILTPSPSAADASDYAAALTGIRDAVAQAAPDVAVGASIDGGATPRTTVPALGRALAGSPVDVVAFRPAAAVAPGAWTTANVPQLTAALTKALGAAPPVLLDGLPASTPAAYAQTVAANACSPTVAGILLDRIQDSADPEVAPSGLYTVDGTAKPGVPAFTAAVAAAQRGTQVCPGVAFAASASTLEFPTALSVNGAPVTQLACVRDCLYLVTLDGPDGLPVVARRGSLRGGAPAAPIALPAAKLGAGPYRVDVRLVGQVNPGTVTRTLSPPLTPG